MRLPRRGNASVEQLVLAALVAAGGVAAFARLGAEAGGAIAGRASGHAPVASLTFVGAGPREAPAVAVAAEAGAAGAVARFRSLVEPGLELTEDVRRVRTDRWAEPRVAFGQSNNPIQFSLELEGDAPDISAVYRPRGVPERRWNDMDPTDQWDYIERYRGSYYDGPGNAARSFRWNDMVRRPDVPYPLSRRLDWDIDDRWETRTTGFVRTLDDLFAQASYLDEEVGEGGFHWHASFRRAPAHDEDVLAYWQHAEEYLRLRMIESDATNVHAPFVRPLKRRILDDVRASWADRDNAPVDQKYHPVGLRGRIYGSESRIGFEIRAANYDLEEAARVMDSTVRFLEDPAKARISMNRGVRRYGMDAVRSVDRGPPPVRDRVALEKALKRAGGYAHSDFPEYFMMPFVRWEDRPWLAHRAKEIQSARAAYGRALRRALALRGRREAKLDALERALGTWAEALELSRHY